jgi:hypothetical protein
MLPNGIYVISRRAPGAGFLVNLGIAELSGERSALVEGLYARISRVRDIEVQRAGISNRRDHQPRYRRGKG